VPTQINEEAASQMSDENKFTISLSKQIENGKCLNNIKSLK